MTKDPRTIGAKKRPKTAALKKRPKTPEASGLKDEGHKTF
jgi:hypothetical protein